MMNDSSPRPLIFTVALATSTLVAALYWNKKCHDGKRNAKQRVSLDWPDSIDVFLPKFASPNGPQYILDTGRQLNKEAGPSSSHHSVYRIPALSFLPEWLATLFFPPTYLVMDYNIARKVLEDPNSTKPIAIYDFFCDTTSGPNFVAVNGRRWKHVRQSASKTFTTQTVKRTIETISQLVDKWIQERFPQDQKEIRNIDILQEMLYITTDTVASAVFCYNIEVDERDTLLSDLQTCWYEFSQGSYESIFRKFNATRWMFAGYRRGRDAAASMHRLCLKMLQQYRARDQPAPGTLIHAIANDPEYVNDQERACDLVSLVIAGFDTTANTLAFCFYELARDLELQSDLRKALQACKNPEEARQCPALRNLVRETLRYWPTIAGGPARQVHRDVYAPPPSPADQDGVNGQNGEKATSRLLIPAGSVAAQPLYAIHRDARVFAPDPDVFRPSRWEQPTEEMSRCTMAFAPGNRSCLGQSLAQSEIYEVVSKVIPRFEFAVEQEGTPHYTILLKPKGTILKARALKA